MTEQDIMTLLQRKRRYETEIAILRDCSDELYEAEQTKRMNEYALLKRRLSMISHWLNYLSAEESFIVELRLIKNKSWPYIAEKIQNSSNGLLPCDERTAQRQLDKAISKLFRFMKNRFGRSMDFLIDDTE